MFKLLLVLSACLCVGYAAVSIGPLMPKPKEFKDQEGCYIDSLKAVIPFGQSRPSKTAGSCMEYRCSSTMIQYVTCGAVAAVPPCKVVSDKAKPYPACCPRVACP
ncbi:la1-like protein 15 [Vanessa cardui]|uniref:la1-like protein 15 n=1 Tax=Vanessa cardui TaxID=171605 RepID=UPI001F12EEDE|nr:la1-like protein 15 [Vanessa cardui]